MPIPSQALLADSEKEGVETRRQAPKIDRYGEGIVQTTNRQLVAKAIVVRKSAACNGRAGSTPAPGTKKNNMDKTEDQSYEFKLSILGHEIFAAEIKTTSTSDRWVAITLITVFCSAVVLGAYGDKFVNLYRSLTATEALASKIEHSLASNGKNT